MIDQQKKHRHTNKLIHETSPYLLQHAHNPVDWHAWNSETLAKARSLDKMLLISIGYSACHWCHVMERESFEDEDVARVMNEHFICIKVDREERPDLDQIYMNAVQLISGGGGWPLNCFALPDGRPFFGGTYFKKYHWLQLLDNIAVLYEARREELDKQASDLTEGVRRNGLTLIQEEKAEIAAEDTDTMVRIMEGNFDLNEGGSAGTPKFPMPNNYLFLLRYAHSTNNRNIMDHVVLTLRKMAFGGIYDQVGGGFARYSTDSQWKIPHFEKMLYDNAQLISLYAEAFAATKDTFFKEIAKQSINFVQQELNRSGGGFYSALDADAGGEEGRYYGWTGEEINSHLENKSDIFKKYYHIDNSALWENEMNILHRTQTEEEFAQALGIGKSSVKKLLESSRRKLLKARKRRLSPGLDDKILTSWNALMIKALTDAARFLNNDEYLVTARFHAEFLLKHLKNRDGGLFHSWKNGRATINGFLEDYALLADALIGIYQLSFDERWLIEAKELAGYALEHFYDEQRKLFLFTSDTDPELVVRKAEVHDNVIPSSNSVMAHVLFKLGQLFDTANYLETSLQMLKHIRSDMTGYPSAFSNWGLLTLIIHKPFYTVAIIGNDAQQKLQELIVHYSPAILLAGSTKESSLPILQDRYTKNKTMIYVCTGRTCKLPVTEVRDAINLVNP